MPVPLALVSETFDAQFPVQSSLNRNRCMQEKASGIQSISPGHLSQ